MWMPRRFRRQIHDLTEDADRRLAEAQAQKEETDAKAAHVNRLADTSERLARQNGFASLIQRIQHTGGH